MLIVLYLGGHVYPLGPSRNWLGWLRDLAATLGPTYELVMGEGDRSATIRTVQGHHEIYRVALEPWPSERGAWKGAPHA